MGSAVSVKVYTRVSAPARLMLMCYTYNLNTSSFGTFENRGFEVYVIISVDFALIYLWRLQI